MIDREKHPILTESDIEDFLKQLKPMELSILEMKVKGFDSVDQVKDYFKSAVEEAQDAAHSLHDAITTAKRWLKDK
jgi:hypothetical protein